MKVRFFNPGKAYENKKDVYDSEIQRVLRSGDLILRKDVETFEENLARFCGKKYAVGLNSGTDALYLSLWAIGIGPGDEVVVPSHTFVATAQVVAQLGAVPVLVDMDEDWRDYITEKTRACIPAHIAGEILDWKPVDGIPMIDDSCQSLGADGFRGVVQCWSFYPAKILGAFGDAGGITTDNEILYEEIKELRGHYKKDYSRWGINSRLDNLQAAILNIKIADLNSTLARRKEIADRYSGYLAGPEGLPLKSEGRVWQDYIIRTKKRDELHEFLREVGVETMINEYPMPIGKKPRAAAYEAETLRLPINEILTNEEVDYVIEMINEFYAVQ
jgi:dTDP-4-amino-4,6-dideoxygalactose transaminase